MNERILFPFTAIVGQERMLRALILNAIDPRIGGVLIRGERGTAKSTAARALASLLPLLSVIEGCRFACDPHNPASWCSECRARQASGESLRSQFKPTPFVNLPVSATEDRVVGTLDIEQAIQKGERRFEPGVLAAVNRGMLYIDEVNLLDDHVVDVLLDSAAMGSNVVEREGISFTHPARFILIGTMNPEEGDLRPQLLDRFAFSVDIHGILDKAQRVEIMRRNLAFDADPVAFRQTFQAKEEELSARIASARERLEQVSHTSRDLLNIAELTTSLEVDGHRSDLVILKGARAHASLEGRTRILPADIAVAAELALPHRVKEGPFRKSEMGIEALNARLEGLRGQTVSEEGDESAPQDEDAKKKQTR